MAEQRRGYDLGPMAGTGSTVENRVKIVLIIQSL